MSSAPNIEKGVNNLANEELAWYYGASIHARETLLDEQAASGHFEWQIGDATAVFETGIITIATREILKRRGLRFTTQDDLNAPVKEGQTRVFTKQSPDVAGNASGVPHTPDTPE